MFKISKLLLIIVFVFWGIYLLLPPSKELPPLPQSLKSIEPGDTVQIPGVSAYYTDLSRAEVIKFYQDNFTRSSFLEVPLITYRLNHPPEYVKTLLRDTQQTSYLEEVVHPLRESLFINGFEWENDPFTVPDKRVKNKMIINGHEYKAKITIFQRNSNPFFRLIVSGGVLILSLMLFNEIKKLLNFKD